MQHRRTTVSQLFVLRPFTAPSPSFSVVTHFLFFHSSNSADDSKQEAEEKDAKLPAVEKTHISHVGSPPDVSLKDVVEDSTPPRHRRRRLTISPSDKDYNINRCAKLGTTGNEGQPRSILRQSRFASGQDTCLSQSKMASIDSDVPSPIVDRPLPEWRHKTDINDPVALELNAYRVDNNTKPAAVKRNKALTAGTPTKHWTHSSRNPHDAPSSEESVSPCTKRMLSDARFSAHGQSLSSAGLKHGDADGAQQIWDQNVAVPLQSVDDDEQQSSDDELPSEEESEEEELALQSNDGEHGEESEFFRSTGVALQPNPLQSFSDSLFSYHLIIHSTVDDEQQPSDDELSSDDESEETEEEEALQSNDGEHGEEGEFFRSTGVALQPNPLQSFSDSLFSYHLIIHSTVDDEQQPSDDELSSDDESEETEEEEALPSNDGEHGEEGEFFRSTGVALQANPLQSFSDSLFSYHPLNSRRRGRAGSRGRKFDGLRSIRRKFALRLQR